MPRKTDQEIIGLRFILWTYIILCLIIAGLNYGYAKTAPEPAAKMIAWTWHFYENWVKTVFIIVSSVLTIRIIGRTKRTRERKRNLTGLITAALVVHIFGPLLLDNQELYFFAMPLPWTTVPLQLLYEGSSFYDSRFPLWGMSGVAAAMLFYGLITGIVFTGTLLLGRRWQCSTLCLFNGFASEVFDPVFPLAGKTKKDGSGVLRALKILKWISFALAAFLSAYWILLLSGTQVDGVQSLAGKVELYKYLGTELLMMMFFWVFFTGRGYCYYCPLGTLLGCAGKIAGQKIITDKTACIGCGECNKACSMAIDIKSKAREGEPVTSLRCVGCGHCVDACPTETLSYATTFTSWIGNRKKQRHEDALASGKKGIRES